MINVKYIFLMAVVTLMVLPAITISGTVNLPETGQTTCYDISGTVIPCTGTGQDGEIQTGVAWPNPRSTDNGDGTMTDNLTGLVWAKDANFSGVPRPGRRPLIMWQG